MTITDSINVSDQEPRHAAAHRQASQPLMRSTNRSPRTGPAIPKQSAIGPNSLRMRTARPSQPHHAMAQQPHNTGNANPLSP